jgi:hypothetical protein
MTLGARAAAPGLPGASMDDASAAPYRDAAENQLPRHGSDPVIRRGIAALLSDPKGVDFKPYLAQVLASVKRYWLLILPKNGHRGYVSVQFAILRDGTVRKVASRSRRAIPAWTIRP